MKTIYSLQEFRNQLLEIAKLKDESFVEAKVAINYEGKVYFSGYVRNLGGWDSFETTEECLTWFRNKVTPPANKNIDVEIEMPEPVIEVVEPISADDLPF